MLLGHSYLDTFQQHGRGQPFSLFLLRVDFRPQASDCWSNSLLDRRGEQVQSGCGIPRGRDSYKIPSKTLLLLITTTCVLSCSVMSNSSAPPWTVARQAPLSMGFSRQEYCSGLPCSPPQDLPDPGIKLRPPALAGRFFTTELPGKPGNNKNNNNKE